MTADIHRNPFIEDLLARLEPLLAGVCEEVSSELVESRGGKQGHSHFRVSYYNEPLLGGQKPTDVFGVSDCFSALAVEGGPGILLFIDPSPGANWGHDCWFVTLDVDHLKLKKQHHLFPPQEDDVRHLVPYALW
jgi:hypothetical protein